MLVLIVIVFFLIVFLIQNNSSTHKKSYEEFIVNNYKENLFEDPVVIRCLKCEYEQSIGSDFCQKCKESWYICRECLIPFEEGSSVLISPCCGQGFHPDHYVQATKKNQSCPHCLSFEIIRENLPDFT